MNTAGISIEAEKRIIAHRNAKPLLFQGEYKSALTALLSARSELGDNINLKGDIATCYYYTGNILEWKTLVDEAAADLEKLSNILHVNSFYSASILLAKFREEEGKIAEAIRIYEKCLGRLNRLNEPEFYYLCAAQLLRLAGQFQIFDKLRDYYGLLNSIKNIEENFLDRIDIQHALMLAEFSLVSPEKAVVRLDKILAFPKLEFSEKSLVFYDLVEAFLRTRQPLPLKLIELSASLPGVDLYEQSLNRFAFQSIRDLPIDLLNKVSLANALRLLSLVGAYTGVVQKQEELRRQVRLLLLGVSVESQRIWHNYLQDFLAKQRDIVVQLVKSPPELRVGKDSISLRGKRNLVTLLVAIAESEDRSHAAITEKVWMAKYNESYYHRIRMLIQRINLMLLKQAGIDKCFIITSSKIELKNSITLTLI